MEGKGSEGKNFLKWMGVIKFEREGRGKMTEREKRFITYIEKV